MSGFKTPTAMSPPRRQARSPLMTASDMKAEESPNSGQQSGIYPYIAMPGLMEAFEKLDSVSCANAGTAVPRQPPIIQHRATSPRGRIETDATTSVPLSTSSILEEDITINLDAIVGDSSSTFSPPLSGRRPSESIEQDRPNTAPYQAFGSHQPVSPSNNVTTVLRSPFKAYGHISESVSLNSPSSRSLPQSRSSPEFEIYRRHESNGRLMVCEAREEHCSHTVTNFVGERTGLRSIADLKAGLMRKMCGLGDGGLDRAKADLKVVTGNMLERIVAWDLNRAEALEQVDIPLLSTVPTTASLNKVDAMYIIKMFRSGMHKIPGDDIRSKIGRLPDQDLMALLHFTLLISRPVLVWELDLDEI